MDILPIAVIIIIAVLIFYIHGTYEQFDASGTEFIPLGEQQYDLRGFPVYNRPLYDCWYDNYKNCYNSNF